MPSEILRVSIFLSYLGKFYVARNLLFSKVTKKFSWTYTLEFWAEIFSQYSPLKVEEHNVPSEFRSDAWFMRKKIVSILKKPHCIPVNKELFEFMDRRVELVLVQRTQPALRTIEIFNTGGNGQNDVGGDYIRSKPYGHLRFIFDSFTVPSLLI